MPLTDVAVRAAKPREKSYKLADGQGMYLEVMPNGSKYWRLKYRIDGKEKRMALGAIRPCHCWRRASRVMTSRNSSVAVWILRKEAGEGAAQRRSRKFV